MSIEVELLKPITGKKADEVFVKLAAGMSYAEVAAELHRDVETIKSHSKVVREILHAKTVVEAVAIAVARGIITITEAGGKSILLALLIAGSDVSADIIKSKTKPTVVRTVRVRNQL